MAGALLVAHQDVPHIFLLKHLVIDRKHRAAGIAEHMLDTLILQGAHHHLSAGHLFGHRLLGSVCGRPLPPSVVPSAGPML
jgi:hypothetical protein